MCNFVSSRGESRVFHVCIMNSTSGVVSFKRTFE